MGAVLMVVAALFGLLVLLLAVPIDVAFRFQGLKAFTGQITIRWLFGLVRFRVNVPGAPEPPAPEAEIEAKAAKARAKPKERDGGANAFAVLRQAAFRQRVYRFIKDLLRAAHLHQLRLRLRLGLGDPADTGRLWAFVGPLAAAAQNLRNAEVRIEPEFTDPALDFDAFGRLRFIPLQLIALVIAFALSPPSIRAWRTLKESHA